jgi:hypothetical protein
MLGYLKKKQSIWETCKYIRRLSVDGKTRPGGALFEGTFRFDEETKKVQMTGDISRINVCIYTFPIFNKKIINAT